MDTTSYEEWLLTRSLGRATIYNYRGKVLAAHRIAEGQGWDLRQLTASQVAWLADQFPDTASTRRILRCALTHYWEMVGSDSPASAISCPVPPPARYRGLDDADAARLEATARGRWPDGGAVMLGLYLALRRAEIAGLRWDHFAPELTEVRVIGKGRRTRFLPVHPVLRSELARRRCDGFLFPGHVGRAHAHTATVRAWIGQVAEDVGLTITNPHSLRYTCLTRLYEETGDIHLVQEFAGHADPATTARYLTRVREERMRAAVARINYRQAQGRAA